MPNKLDEIFSDEMFNINGKVRFKDEEAYKSFLSALDVVQTEGRVVPIAGVTSISTEIQSQDFKYPLQEHTNISELVIGPAVETVDIDVCVSGAVEKVRFRRYTISGGTVLETDQQSIIYFKFLFHNDNFSKHTITYKVQFEVAKEIQEIIKASSLALALIEKLYNEEDLKSAGEEGVLLIEMKKRFRVFVDYFNRVAEVEKALGLRFEPIHLKELSYETQKDIEELYILLCNKEVIRVNAKINSSNVTFVSPEKTNDFIIGKGVKLCFIGTIEYQLFGHKIVLYSANLLTNAVVKEVRQSEGNAQVFYGDTDAKPMYLSYTAFLAEEEAQQEANRILEHEEIYVGAKTIDMHIEQYSK